MHNKIEKNSAWIRENIKPDAKMAEIPDHVFSMADLEFQAFVAYLVMWCLSEYDTKDVDIPYDKLNEIIEKMCMYINAEEFLRLGFIVNYTNSQKPIDKIIATGTQKIEFHWNRENSTAQKLAETSPSDVLTFFECEAILKKYRKNGHQQSTDKQSAATVYPFPIRNSEKP